MPVVVPTWEIATPIADGASPDIRAGNGVVVDGQVFLINTPIALAIDTVSDMDRLVGESTEEETRPLTEPLCYHWSVTGIPGDFNGGIWKGHSVTWVPGQAGIGGVFHCTIDDDDVPDFTAYIDFDPHMKGTKDDAARPVQSPSFTVIRALIVSIGTEGCAGLPVSGVPIEYKLEPNGVSGHVVLEVRDSNGNVVGNYGADESGGSHSWSWNGMDLAGNPCPAGVYDVQLRWTVPWGSGQGTTARDSGALTLVKLDLAGHWPGKPGDPGDLVAEADEDDPDNLWFTKNNDWDEGNVDAQFFGAIPDTPDGYAHYPGGPDLGGLPYLDGYAGKVETKVNFYNPVDYALKGIGWACNNATKPDGGATRYFGYEDNDGGLGSYKETDGNGDLCDQFYRHPPLADRDIQKIGETSLPDRYRVFAYCAESRNKAMGRVTALTDFGGFDLQVNGLNY
ncbi:MAG: hypothetical protein GXP31_11995, partial [Kiritimatiellaeota bacterium]|nr:hypothetical protein [Kiritimatiellota bacterium]